MRRTGGSFLRTAMLSLALASLAAGAFWYLDQPGPRLASQDVLFRVEEGDSATAIARRLESQGLIRSSLLLEAVTRLTATDTLYRSGTYRLRAGATALEIHRVLVSGEQGLLKVTVPEGFTMRKIAALLARSGVVGDEEGFLRAARSRELLAALRVPARSAEGYLFPDTYFFPPDLPPEAVLRAMVENFRRRLARVAPEADSWSPEQLHERVILASIVEREYRIPSEAPLIASVFLNRLRHGIGLESCATVEYIITEIRGQPHPGFITGSDLKIDSPYNTYKWAGLPPGPISNPGEVALDAALHPARTDYYYFVLKDPATGEHHFSTSLIAHNEAKRFYLKSPGW